jgi:hypothetical protein
MVLPQTGWVLGILRTNKNKWGQIRYKLLINPFWFLELYLCSTMYEFPSNEINILPFMKINKFTCLKLITLPFFLSVRTPKTSWLTSYFSALSIFLFFPLVMNTSLISVIHVHTETIFPSTPQAVLLTFSH